MRAGTAASLPWLGFASSRPSRSTAPRTEASVEAGDWVANRYTVRGTHTGDFFGSAPTGRRFEVRGMDMVRVHNGELVEHWMVAEPI